MKLKLFFVPTLLIAFSFIAKGQSLSLEQTVDYINELFKSKSAWYSAEDKINKGWWIETRIQGIQVEKSGRITFFKQYNETSRTLFDAIESFSVFDLESAEWADEDHLRLRGKNNVNISTIKIDNQPDGNRLYRAIWHLKEVCTKSADPFGN